MPSDFLSSTKTQFAQALDPKIRPNNLNHTPFAEFLASHLVSQPSGNTRATNFSCYCFTATGAIHSPRSRTCCVQRAVLLPPAWWFHRPRASCGSRRLPRFLATPQATDLAGEWIDERVISSQL